MREIKFRGKRIDNGEWVCGYLVPYSGKDYETKERWCICDGILSVHEVDSATVGQFTGLKDKNGKEIYEGDVVRLFGGEYCQGYYEHDQTIVVKSAYDIVAMEESENVQLLGNVWDNPELWR